jgi:hypothetical protein
MDIVVTGKMCSKCRRVLPRTEFSRNRARYDGRANYCKVCARKQVRTWELSNVEKVAAIQARYKVLHPNADKMKQKRYRERHPLLVLDRGRSERMKKPKCVSARKKLSYAIKTGKVIRPDRCDLCLLACRPQGHHDDYERPLTVRWLCARCHKLHHLSGE